MSPNVPSLLLRMRWELKVPYLSLTVLKLVYTTEWSRPRRSAAGSVESPPPRINDLGGTVFHGGS
ncbi:predicted protein [Streptomyces filamentosus NRRL 15998]|uniref:Predicted protein n=1 Tax=Streptomyces filamentosus NRRL 15998 TaxID=457431 RepID=D6AG38_STRFL|nr:predicted protein [Streptomyces filamentosus NRRL 15998]